MTSDCPVLTLYADNLDESTVPEDVTVHKGARAVIVDNGRVLLVHLKKHNTYTLPGGGIEEGETPFEALTREVKEETGLSVKDASMTLLLKEYFPDSIWHHHFFIVKTDREAKKAKQSLTEEEWALGFETVMKPIDEAIEILSNNWSTYPHGANIQHRELLGLIHSV